MEINKYYLKFSYALELPKGKPKIYFIIFTILYCACHFSLSLTNILIKKNFSKMYIQNIEIIKLILKLTFTNSILVEDD